MNKIFTKIYDNKRITLEEGLELFKKYNLIELASLAHNKRLHIHPDKKVTYVIDRNINYTNVCVAKCKFCAFHKSLSEDGSYIISKRELSDKINETINLGGTQILLQGGIHPELGIDYYIELLEFIKNKFDIHIHGFSPPEINFISKKSSMTIKKTISLLKNAGLSSIPGGGAEILCDDIRKKISPNKCTSDEWIEVMRQAHFMGMRSSATMMFGHLEKNFHILKHLDRIRSLQDETNGFTAFIPWSFQPDNTPLSVTKTTAVEYLKVLAISRIFLDNVDNIQASWVTQGDKIAQTSLFFGANDMGSTMIEENVVASTGVTFMLSEKELIRLIIKAGFEPHQRDCYYNLLT